VSRWAWVAWDKLDPLGTQLGVFTDLSERECLVPWDGAGSGSFVINRHSAQAAWVATRNYITVHLATEQDVDDPEDHPAVFGFFVEEGLDVIVSRDEEGGEAFKRGGRGALIYLERAIVDHIQRTANAFSIDADKMNLVWTDKKVGRVLHDLIDEAHARSPDPLPDLTIDFTDSVDSNGDPWDTIDDEFNIPIGLDLLAAIEPLKGQGLSVVMTPDLMLHAYQDWSPPSSGVTFEKGINIREAADREVHATTAKSRMLVQGTRKSGATIYKTSTDPTVEAEEGVFEGFFRYNRNATVARLEKAGQRRLRALKRLHDGATTVGVTVGDGSAGVRGTAEGHYVPFTDYSPGETVTLEVPGEYEGLVKMLGGIVLEDTEAGEYDPSIQFDVPDYNPGVGELQPGGGGPSGGPEFGGDQPPGVPGGATTPAPTSTTACASATQYAVTEQVDPSGAYAASYGTDFTGGTVGSWVYYNEAYTVTGCPIGGGAWVGWHDAETWFQFTAPADDPDYLGLSGVLDLTGTGIGGTPGGYQGPMEWGVYAGAAGAFPNQGTLLGTATPGALIPFYVPRSLVNWGGANCIFIRNAWDCERGAFYCNPIATFNSPLDDGRGASGQWNDFALTSNQVCTLVFASGSGLAVAVAGYGDVDGTNTVFTLIGWDGTGTPSLSINGLEQPTADITFDTVLMTATLAYAPPEGALVLWTYPESTP
jgi:hypothetical protein